MFEKQKVDQNTWVLEKVSLKFAPPFESYWSSIPCCLRHENVGCLDNVYVTKICLLWEKHNICHMMKIMCMSRKYVYHEEKTIIVV